ncbi:MAG: PqqD family peptide modification chaperone, partial [Chloroflexota bacterium]
SVHAGVVGTAGFLDRLVAATTEEGGIKFVARVETAVELMRTAEAFGVVFVQVLSVESTVDVVRALREALGVVPLIVVVPVAAGPNDVRRALRAGADGVVDEPDIDGTLAAAVGVVRAGSVCVPRRHATIWADETLSMREKQVLGLASRGASNHEIAQELFLAETTVKSHLSSAYAKLGVRTRQEATAMILDPAEGLGPGILAMTPGEDSVTVDPPPDQSPGPEGDDSDLIVKVPRHIVYRSLANETVLLDLRTGTYYGLNETAGKMLSALEKQPDMDSVVTQLTRELDAPPERLRVDLRALITGLAAEGLLELETND